VWAVIGLLVGRVLVVSLFVPLHNLVARWAPAGNWAWYRAAVGPLRPVPLGWGPLLGLSGLRGALSVALALSLPSSLAERGLLQGIVYGVVLVTLLGQGIALRVVVPEWRGAQEPA